MRWKTHLHCEVSSGELVLNLTAFTIQNRGGRFPGAPLCHLRCTGVVANSMHLGPRRTSKHTSTLKRIRFAFSGSAHARRVWHFPVSLQNTATSLAILALVRFAFCFTPAKPRPIMRSFCAMPGTLHGEATSVFFRNARLGPLARSGESRTNLTNDMQQVS